MQQEKRRIFPDELRDLKATLSEQSRPASIPCVVARAAALTLEGAATLLRSLDSCHEMGRNWSGVTDSERIQGIWGLLVTAVRLMQGEIEPHNWEEK